MRDPMRWAFTVFRVSGIPIRIHLLFVIVTLGLFLRQISGKHNPMWWVDALGLIVISWFVVILLHELGHCFGARSVGGEAKEVLIWPLGGLAYVDVPHTPRANFIATVCGPLVNVLICVVCAVALIVVGGFLPNLNPISNPYVSEMHSVRDGKDYTSPYGLKLYKKQEDPNTAPEPFPSPWEASEKAFKDAGISRGQPIYPPDANEAYAAALTPAGVERALAPSWAVWLNRVFYISWVLLLFNLIPAYPLDGGRMLQEFIWGRSDYRRGVTVAAYTGFGVAVLFLIISIVSNEALFMGLALFMLYESSMALHRLEADEGPFGYDFSAGYTSLEKDDEEQAPRPKKVGWLTRWRQARRARKMQREAEERAAEEARMDEILEKIARSGKESLTDEEKRFLERVSARKRNMS
jgi:Zn-dependent protease